ncbi:protein translocase subunit SecDF [Metamycoplasma hyosynoviae]|uniref:protein translocase subunit SecDF n=1 Tax=Metamycoplasma hyosynoviae TaxID=29559 RepID=UPI00235F296C|nr:hypothetical protein [Metamycoplasma hyosynoviae]MDD1373114.1 hypothetical protein [Metamycoplasma hyosynoviae]
MKKERILNRKLRWIINIFIIIAMLITIIFGSIFYLKPKFVNKTDSGIQGVKTTLEIKKNLNSGSQASDKEILNATKKYLHNANLLSAYDVSLSGKNQITISNYNSKTNQQKLDFIYSLEEKPYLTFTDWEGNPLFYKGKYQSASLPTNERKTFKDLVDGNPEDFMPDLVKNPASSHNQQGYSKRVSLTFTENGWSEYIKFANDMYQQYFRTGLGRSSAYIWLNFKKYVKESQSNPTWQNGPVTYAFADGKIDPEELKDKDNKPTNFKVNPYIKPEFAKYLVFSGHPISMIPSNSVLDTKIFIYNENKDGYTDVELASAINFSLLPFTLKSQHSYFITDASAKNKFLVVIAILYSLFAVFLIARYRFFGLVAAVSIAFFIFMVIVVLTLLNIFISSIIAFTIIVLLLLVMDLINNQLSIIKKEIQKGSNATKAVGKSAKYSLFSSLDTTFISIVGAILLIYISVSYSTVIGITIFTTTIIGFVIIGLIQTLILKSLTKTESFDTTSKAILWSNKYSQAVYKVDLISKSKYFSIGFGVFAFIALAVYFSLSIANKSLINGLNLSNELKSEYNYLFIPNGTLLSQSEANKLLANIKVLNIKNITNAQIVLIEEVANKLNYSVLVSSSSNIFDKLNIDKLTKIQQLMADGTTSINQITITGIESVPLSLLSDINTFFIILAIFIFLTSFYILLRYTWVSMVMFVLKMVFVLSFSVLTMLLTYAPININVLDTLLVSAIVIAHDSVISSAKITGKLKKELNTKNFIYQPDDLKLMFKKHVIDSFDRQIMFALFAIVIIPAQLKLMSELSKIFTYGFAYSLISLFFVNMFLIPNIWLHTLIRVYKNKEKRINTNYWKNKSSVEEQMINGINDFAM